MTDKTMVDVADKAVDKLAGGVEQVAKAFEKVAPHVWEVMVRQARNEAIAGLILAAMCCCLACLTPRVVLRVRAHDWKFNADRQSFSAACALIGIVLAFFAVGMGYGGALRLANPQYYAAKEIIEAVAK